jgi:hypothetical protein
MGFLTALVLVGLVLLWTQVRFSGGIVSDSPNARYHISVMAPLSPSLGSSYRIKLLDKRSSAVVRSITVTVPRSESTVALRDGGGEIKWDAGSSFADVTTDGTELIRVWVP